MPLKIYHLNHDKNLPFLKVLHNFLKNSFFSFTNIEWNKLLPDLRNSESYNALKNISKSTQTLMTKFDKKCSKITPRYDLFALLLCLRNFQDLLNAFRTCDLNAESTSRYVLHCPLFAVERKFFLGNIKVLTTNSQNKIIWFWRRL